MCQSFDSIEWRRIILNIMLTKIRIHNFRSIEDMDVSLGMVNVVIGANNCGKSNFLKAINLALGQYKTVSEEDIFVAKDEVLDKTKCATVDIMIQPVNGDGQIVENFDDFWISTFTDFWITLGAAEGDYVGIRTIVEYDAMKNDYTLIHKHIMDWGGSISEATVSGKKYFTGDMLSYISAFYMDAQRDVVADIRDKKSYFGKATSKIDLPQDVINNIESQLNTVNSQIVENIPALNDTTSRISAIAPTIGDTDGVITIEPLARKMSDLHKGMDIIYRDGNAAGLSVAQHGMGTRSWISFLTLGAYVDWMYSNQQKEDDETDSYVMLTLEEPEAHLHPQAQQKLYSQLCGFRGQKIVSTHSSNVIMQAELDNLIHFEKQNGKTTASRFDATQFTPEEISRIRREVIASRGDLLFSRAIVLCEGITEEQALPIYFHKQFNVNPIFCGVNIIGIGGQNYKTFLSLIKNFNLPWYIFSDGERNTIKTVKKAVRDVFNEEIENLNNVFILPNGDDYEWHLIHNGYGPEIISAIEKCEGQPGFVSNFMKTRNGSSAGRQKTNKPPCPTCHQDIYEDIIRDYSGTDGQLEAIYDCCTTKAAKAKYATWVAEEIVAIQDETRNIPPKVKELMDAIRPLIERGQ